MSIAENIAHVRERIAAAAVRAGGDQHSVILMAVSKSVAVGMSHDFEVAIEEGSTCVRVGTAIFRERSRP